MVALNPQFTVLAAFCSLAAISAVDGAAIQARYPNSASMSSSSPTKKPTRVPTPVAPLPSGASAASSSGSTSASAATPSASSHADGKKSKKGDKQHKQRMFSPADAAVRLGEMINHGQKSEKRDGLDLDMLNNNVQAHLYARRHDKVAVKGNDYAHMRRRHHHDYNHDPKRDVVSDGANMHKRSSVVIPNSHGSSYIVSHSRRNHGLNVAEARAYLGRRDQGGVQGTIDIMSPSSGTPNGKKIASLYLDPSISNTTDWVLNASETNQTKMYLIAAASMASTSSTSDETPVNLQMPVFDSSRTALVEYCATFDPSPSQPEPLTVEPCFNPSNPSTPHKSQVFTYNEFSGVVRPMWFAGEDDGTTGNMTEPASPSSASTTDDDSDDDGDNIPATPSGAGVANIARDAAQSPQQAPAPQNVTLVFHPEEPEVAPSQSVDDVDPTSTSVVTVTTVDTVTATVTATATSSAVVSSISASASAMDDGDAGLSSLAMSSASVSASAFSSGSVSASSAAVTSSVLNVEVVGAIASTSAPAPTSGSASASASGSMSAVITSTATDSASASTSTTGTSSLDAEAIASDIAGSDSDSSASASTTASSYSGSASASGTPVSTTASASGSAAAMDAGASTSSPVSSAASSTMTAVSTAPYQWMFKSERL